MLKNILVTPFAQMPLRIIPDTAKGLLKNLLLQ